MHKIIKVKSTDKLFLAIDTPEGITQKLDLRLQVEIQDNRGIVDIQYIDCTYTIIDKKGEVYYQTKLDLPENIIRSMIRLLQKEYAEEDIILHCIDEKDIEL